MGCRGRGTGGEIRAVEAANGQGVDISSMRTGRKLFYFIATTLYSSHTTPFAPPYITSRWWLAPSSTSFTVVPRSFLHKSHEGASAVYAAPGAMLLGY